MILTQDDIYNQDDRYRALFINSLSGFKSANLIGTSDASGNTNLAIVSSIVHLGAKPPLLGMIMRPHTVPRGTLENILETGWYTLNHVHTKIYKEAHQTSARYADEVSEFDATGLKEEWVKGFFAPFVQQSHIKLGMKFREQHSLSINHTEMIIGEIVYIELPDDIVSPDGYVSIEQARSVAVSSLDSYHQTKCLAHLSYAKPDQALQELPRQQSLLSRLEAHRNKPKKILIVGATGGIGSALCRESLKQFPNSLLIRTARVLGDLPDTTANVENLELDICSDQSIGKAMVKLEQHKDIDWVLIATGWLHDNQTSPEKSFRKLARRHLQKSFAINAISPAIFLKSLLAQQARKHKMHIGILSARVGSISDNRMGGWYSYRASKAALNMLIKNFSIEFKHRRYPHTIIGIQPGTTDTQLSAPFQKGISEDQLQSPEYTAQQLLKLMSGITPDDSGKLFDFLGVEFEP